VGITLWVEEVACTVCFHYVQFRWMQFISGWWWGGGRLLFLKLRPHNFFFRFSFPRSCIWNFLFCSSLAFLGVY
jgi:hypothetical protein